MSELWYIDALDAIAGSGFASFREADLKDEKPDPSVMAIHIDAPFFQAVPIANRALAFAATRGRHQLGLYTRLGEVAFATLDELTEFIRRAYIGSGGGDGAGGGGPAPPGPVPEGGEPLEPIPIEGGEGIAALLEISQDFVAASNSLKYTDAANPVPSLTLRSPGEPHRLETFTARSVNEAEALTRIAAMLMAELILTAPQYRSGPGDWDHAMVALVRAVTRHGVVDEMYQDDRSRLLIGRALQISKSRGGDSDGLEILFEAWSAGGWRWPYDWVNGQERQDALDDLSLWPVPARFRRIGILSLRDYLAAYLASPGILTTAEDAALVLFAAIHIGGQRAVSPWKLSSTRGRLVAESLQWLASQLPNYVFASEIEDLVGGARVMRAAR